MTTNIPTPLTRQELREAVALSIANTQRKRAGLKMMTAKQIREIDPIGWERVDEEADAAIKAYEGFKSRIAKAGECV